MLLSLTLVAATLTAPPIDDGAPEPATRVAERERDRDRDRDDGDDLGFFDKYYPFTFDDAYHEDVEENLVPLYFIQLFNLMPWGPYVFLDDPPSLEFWYELMAIYVIHYILVIPTMYFAWVPIIGWFGVPIWVALNVFYLIPAAVLNAYNRDYVRRHGDGDGRRKRRDGGSSAALPRPPESALLAPASHIAY